MAGIILSLQLRLMRSRVAAFRNDSRRVQTAVVAALVLGYLIYRYGGTVYESVARSGTMPEPGPLFAQLSFSIVFLWVVLPLAYGGRRDLDVRKFQLLPVRPLALAGGLSSTFILSPGVWLTAATAIVLALSFPDATTNFPLLGVSALVLVVMCAVTGQVISTGADLLGRQRHARDLLTLVTFALTSVPVVMLNGGAEFAVTMPPTWIFHGSS